MSGIKLLSQTFSCKMCLATASTLRSPIDSKVAHFASIVFGIYIYIYIVLIFFSSISIWGNTYSYILRPLIILQKKATRIITFSEPGDHSEPLFKKLNILKLTDLVTLHNALLMYNYHHNLLPSSFENFFKTRPVARTFYGWVRSVDYTDQRAPEALFTRGVRGHAPPGNFEN